jgi:hypothetical protein
MNRTWSKLSKRVAYRHIRFTSVKQRERFFSCLQIAQMNKISASKRKQISPQESSPDKPPQVRIARKASFQIQNIPTEAANLIRSLDFGFHPKHLKPHEPELPMSSKTILSSPTSMSPTSSSISPVSRSLGIVQNLSLESPIVTRSMIRAGLTKRVDSVAPRQRVAASSSTNSFTDSASPPSENYGAWSHRFVSPLMPLIGSLIPNLQELSICGCHVNSSDFGVMLQSMQRLERLDISYSTLKSDGVELIGRYCRNKLRWLNISGIFKLGRNKKYGLRSIVSHCSDLSEILAYDCPEIYEETLSECLEICHGKIKFQLDLTR